MRAAGETEGGVVSVTLRPREWAPIAEALSVIGALGPAYRAVARWDWTHGDDCPHHACPDTTCEGGDADCEAHGVARDCARGHVMALLDALRPLMPGAKL